MRIRMKTTAAGPLGSKREGEHYDVDDAEGQALIDGGYAEKVEPPAPIVDEAPAVVPADVPPVTAVLQTSAPEASTPAPTDAPPAPAEQ